MKKIRIVSDLSPEQSILYYKTIFKEYRRRSGGQYYPDILIYSIDFRFLQSLEKEGTR